MYTFMASLSTSWPCKREKLLKSCQNILFTIFLIDSVLAEKSAELSINQGEMKTSLTFHSYS